MKIKLSRSFDAAYIAVLVVAVLGISGAGRELANWVLPHVQPKPMSAIEAEQPTRRIEVTLEDVQSTWERIFREEGRKFAPVEHRFFERSKGQACGTDAAATGPFYCSKDRTLNFDLAFFAAITPQMREVEDPAAKLIIAQIAAGAVQDQLGILALTEAKDQDGHRRDHAELSKQLALQADCLTGIWAADAQRRLGTIPERQYASAVRGMRRITEAQEVGGADAPETLNSLGVGTPEEREAAFFRGYENGKLGACLTLGPRPDGN